MRCDDDDDEWVSENAKKYENNLTFCDLCAAVRYSLHIWIYTQVKKKLWSTSVGTNECRNVYLLQIGHKIYVYSLSDWISFTYIHAWLDI